MEVCGKERNDLLVGWVETSEKRYSGPEFAGPTYFGHFWTMRSPCWSLPFDVLEGPIVFVDSLDGIITEHGRRHQQVHPLMPGGSYRLKLPL